MRKAALLLAALAALAYGQDVPEPTSVGNHQLGEAFWKWMTITFGVPVHPPPPQVDMGKFCKTQSQVDRAYCRELAIIQKGGEGEFQTAEKGQPITWKFETWALREAVIDHSGDHLQRDMENLTEAYGPATKTRIVSYENSYGAKWDCQEASWARPDGALILLGERINNLPNLGPTRWVTITFYSKERAYALRKADEGPNPFLPTQDGQNH